MAKGAESKAILTQKILSTFEGSFEYGKEIRVPFTENGERVEIKVTLTCAKTNVGDSEVSAFPSSEGVAGATVQTPEATAAPTEEEKANIANLMSRLGL